MERLLKYIRETNEKKTELEIEYAAMKTVLETKLQNQYLNPIDQSEEISEETSPENIKINLRELEKRLTQQELNYEEALLELEAFQKYNKRQNSNCYHKIQSKNDLGWLSDFIINNSKDKKRNNLTDSNFKNTHLYNTELGKASLADLRERSVFVRSDCASTVGEDGVKYIFDTNNNIPAPVQIALDNHPNQPSCKIIRWKSPDIVKKCEEDCPISSYHIYVDGDFYKAVGMTEPLSVTLPNFDYKAHRISIRSVCPQGQSKDPQCTISINSISPSPSILKATKITGTSATISWMPSNSNLRHILWLNGIKLCECQPEVYKLMLYGLIADCLQKVRVHPVLDLHPDTTSISAYLDFQTLPVCGEERANVPKKPMGYCLI